MENKIIVMQPEKDVIVKKTIYDYLPLCEDKIYVVNHVSEEEFSTMERQIYTMGRLRERDPNFDFSYHLQRYLLFHHPKNAFTYVYDYDHPKKNGSYYIEDGKLFFSEMLIPFPNNGLFYNTKKDLKIYTTDTFQEILNVYKPEEFKEATLALIKKEETRS